jgi:DnaJ-class molecular chaperone
MSDSPSSTTCPFCHGESFRTDGTPCAECAGTGQIPVEQVPLDLEKRKPPTSD